ncbi:MAG: DUF4230 domain-containing protein [Anaerolineales bacterium]|jgi:hypothetical protein
MEKNRNTYILIAILVVILWAAISVVNIIKNTTGELVEPVNVLNTRAAGIFNSTPTVFADPVTIIRDVRSLARLETIHYSLEKVITAETGSGDLSFLFGDKLLFVAHGTVIAGINLENLDEEDMKLRNGTLYVTLPAPEVFVATLDNEKSYVYDRDTGLLTKGDFDLETLARQTAEDAIYEAALEDGILQQAQVNAENYLVRLFRSLGYPDVVLEFPNGD